MNKDIAIEKYIEKNKKEKTKRDESNKLPRVYKLKPVNNIVKFDFLKK